MLTLIVDKYRKLINDDSAGYYSAIKNEGCGPLLCQQFHKEFIVSLHNNIKLNFYRIVVSEDDHLLSYHTLGERSSVTLLKFNLIQSLIKEMYDNTS